MITLFSKLRYYLALMAMVIFHFVNAQQVWYVNANIGNDFFDGQSSTDDGSGIGPFQTIQHGVNTAADMDTIRVAAGDYVGYVLIDKSLIVLGANEGVGATDTRNAESIIYPSVIGLGSPANASNSLIQIASPETTFEGFLINGNNDTVTSGNMVNGVDVDRSYGVLVLGDFNRIVVRYNRVVNFDKGGIESLGNVNLPNTNCFFGYNLFQNFGDESIGITCGNGFYSDIFNNSFDDVENGVSLYDFTMNSGRPILIAQNDIKVRISGVLLSNLNNNTSNVYIDNNVITAVVGMTGEEGVAVTNCLGNYNLEIRDCDITNFETGIFMFNNDLPLRFILRDSIENCNVGVTSITTGQNMRTDSLSMQSNFINECTETGIAIFADTTRTILNMEDCMIKDCGRGIYSAGNVELRPGASSFENIGGYFIELDTANSTIVSAVPVNAHQCLFDGNTGKLNTHEDNFMVEDKIRHHMDSSLFAYVSFRDSSIYVSNNDGNNVVMRAVGRAVQDWHVHIKDVVSLEAIAVAEQIHITSYNKVKLGTLTINASGGKQVFLHDTLTVVDGLTLNSGRLNTRDGLCSVGEILVKSGHNNVIANGASYVDGPLQVVLQTSGLDTLLFPVGTSNSYRSLQVFTQNASVGNWDRVQATLISGNTPLMPVSQGISHVSDVHYWQMSSTNGLVHDDIEYKGVYSVFGTDDQAGEGSSLRLANAAGGQWVNIGGTGSGDNNGTIQSGLLVTTITDVVLANAKSGKNRLGKGDVIAAFDGNSVCDGQTVIFSENSTALVGVISAYHWDFGDTAIVSDTSITSDPTYIYNGPGSYTVRLIVTSDLGTSDTTFRTINVYSNPNVGFVEEIYCFPNAARFIDTSSVTAPDVITFRNWDIDGASYGISPVTHAFPTTGSYTAKLIVETQFGCKDSVSKTFFQGDSVKISISPTGPITICAGDTIQLTATAGFDSYYWTSGGDTNFVQAYLAQTYIVTAFNSNYCFGIDSVSLSLVPAPVADAGSDVFIEYGESTILQGNGGGTYVWSPPDRLSNSTDPNATATPLKTTTYILTVTNAQGCSDQDTVVVSVGLPKLIEVPNHISPNGDMLNDVWDLSNIPDIENTKVSVLNRWGKVVFSSNNYQHDWAGTYEGEPLPDGTYLYIIEGSEFYDALKGPIQIIR